MKSILYSGLLVGLVVAVVNIHSVTLEDYTNRVQDPGAPPYWLSRDRNSHGSVIAPTENIPSHMYRRRFPSNREVFLYVAIDPEEYTIDSESAWGTPTLATTLKEGYQDEIILDYKPLKEGSSTFQLRPIRIERTTMPCDKLEAMMNQDDQANILSLKKTEKKRKIECSAMLPVFDTSSTRYKIANEVVEITRSQSSSFSTTKDTTFRPSSQCVIELHSKYNESGIFTVECRHSNASKTPYMLATLQIVKDENSELKLIYPFLARTLPNEAIGLEFSANPLLYGEQPNKIEYHLRTFILLSYKNIIVRREGVQRLINEIRHLGSSTD